MTAPSMPERLRAQQSAFTAHLRDPATHAAPAGVDESRLALYRELVFGNFDRQLRAGFPLVFAVLGATRWAALIGDFLAAHRCRTPYFPALGEEFVCYLQHGRAGLAGDPSFLLELAHYEWVEQALDIADVEPDWQRVDATGDLLNGLPVLSPVAWSLSYRYPVHRIGPGWQPCEPPAEPTFLLVYRAVSERVGFTELNAATARLLEIITGGEVDSGHQALVRLAREMGYPEPARLIRYGGELLQQLHACGAILGILR